MSKQKFAFGGGAMSLGHWPRSTSTLPVNKPVLWTTAAVIFSMVAVGSIAVISKVTATSSQPGAAPQFGQKFDTSEPVAPTLSVRPVAATIITRPPEPAQQARSDFATTGAANTEWPAPRERTAAKAEADDPWPKTMAKTAAAKTASNASAPIDCLPDALRTVLTELQARFGSVTVVATKHLHTDNHSPGSARANMHSACKAVDIKTSHDPKDVLAFLRTRPEVGGINSYRNKVIHFDLNAGYRTAGRAGQ